ncbi:MAG TPA: methylenetetrahydrofolate--tRNA-(uracil(54)-C(5))-methyltransferase (FADH(2)-oxidizing) TrmFO [Candidatus Cloacimonadota bacterium]|jgi:methylenetetrahydrofolate--tRNA-(uracil-5-)-methyltransferase|nr:methylenetetrahydrofolate--tRNA-(uracil(54)-C(5))-methyltransferase (FADH(2)-oxidizing) TrmFO [Candidatus Cloacimonadota bacterium]HOG30666.1 methylenetetrahydrofolate--tRNA-(uracil(54)-C(5))-methyltransferase (FADH(2)-oxidizing) TrmFO [Candidatus Cloacimonadota bacterium]HOR59179.1 methylenetetrahydrofolate--tRNA-(uracil(54)-C(5))-methyltransferase (FADH(2)-oxidizing) TrmFO [Candidatus Cloacimonadota bacterium]HPB09205.1 methylenetetrahydrofolate--tRNA-(uracil(54)-C(5))-methyltransferase (FA
MPEIKIIGAGLAGSEAALCLAEMGISVNLLEMRPLRMTPAHGTDLAAELVCSNSLKSDLLDTASGLLKEELRLLGSRLLPIAQSCAVPAGHALAVDRLLFAQKVTQTLQNHPRIRITRQEVTELPAECSILCAGPLVSDSLARSLQEVVGESQLSFFDAIAPIVSAESIDSAKVYAKDRYDKGEPDYLNCAFTREEYYRFVDALLEGEQHQAREFENEFFREVDFNYYENCTPIEELARRGRETLRHGVMRPMGLERDGVKPFAVLQLRAENKDRTAFNLVGCQTMLRYPEQQRIFRLIPGLEQAEFLRFGSIHRNSYLNAPRVLAPNLTLRNARHIFVAGQLAGVEGYVECMGMGLLVAKIIGEGIGMLPPQTILGQIWRRLIDPEQKNFQPVNANFGILPALDDNVRDKKLKKQLYSKRSLEALRGFLEENDG